MKIGQHWLGRSRGTSTLEFLVVLPSLLLLFLGAVELSRAWLTLNLVTQAAREGARVGSVSCPGTPCTFSSTAALTRISTVLAGANLASVAPTSVTCSAPCGPDAQVTATVTVNFQTIVPLLLPMLSGPFPIGNTAVMRVE
jgi:Flp pilus assembly protein TadG